MSSNYTQSSSGFGRQGVQPGSEMKSSAMGRGNTGTSDTISNQPARTAAEEVQSAMNPSQAMRSDNPGRGFGAGSMPAMETGTRTGMRDTDNFDYSGVGTENLGGNAYTVTTGANTGAGIHAHQYDERTGALGGSGHHPHMHPQGTHQEPFIGECHQPGCATCMRAGGRDVSTAADPSIGTGHHTIGHHTTDQHATGHHTDASATGRTSMAQGTTQQSNVQSTGQHKPTIADKILGGTEKIAGKMTGNEAMETRGAERKAGEFVASNKN